MRAPREGLVMVAVCVCVYVCNKALISSHRHGAISRIGDWLAMCPRRVHRLPGIVPNGMCCCSRQGNFVGFTFSKQLVAIQPCDNSAGGGLSKRNYTKHRRTKHVWGT